MFRDGSVPEECWECIIIELELKKCCYYPGVVYRLWLSLLKSIMLSFLAEWVAWLLRSLAFSVRN